MPAPCLLPRPAVPFASLIWAALACAAHGTAALAAEHAPPAAAAVASAVEPTAEPAAKKPKAQSLEPPAALSRGLQDPMDMLRERLAQKLGATKPPGVDNPNVVRVVSKTSAPVTTEPSPGVISYTAPPRAAARRKLPVTEAALAHATAPLRPAQWAYAGSGGPESWGQLKPEYAKCASGSRQSPIDIRDGIKVDLESVQFDYKASAFRVVDNGHTVQVNMAAGSAIEVMGRRYELVQFDFQRPSEERIDGRQFEMGVHLVHKDAEGRTAVVALLVDRGSPQPVVQSVWNNLPLEKGDEVAARSPVDPGALLPADRGYYTYMGSLTTPPCSEGVLWMVMKTPVQLSAEQIGIFARLYPMNARPVQAAADRLIKESN